MKSGETIEGASASYARNDGLGDISMGASPFAQGAIIRDVTYFSSRRMLRLKKLACGWFGGLLA